MKHGNSELKNHLLFRLFFIITKIKSKVKKLFEHKQSVKIQIESIEGLTNAFTELSKSIQKTTYRLKEQNDLLYKQSSKQI